LQPDQLAKRIRKTLLNQKSKLEEYLTVLDKESDDIINKDPEKLLDHIALERNIIDELSELKKILTPLETMYYNSPYKKDNELVGIKDSLSALTNQINVKSIENKEILETVLLTVKTDLKNIKKLDIVRSAYAKVDSRLVDVHG
jgi:hypothetical protein